MGTQCSSPPWSAASTHVGWSETHGKFCAGHVEASFFDISCLHRVSKSEYTFSIFACMGRRDGRQQDGKRSVYEDAGGDLRLERQRSRQASDHGSKSRLLCLAEASH